MENKEIIKALRHCAVNGSTCRECPAYNQDSGCLDRLHAQAAELLEVQQRRIADHLTANGVTVLTADEQRNTYTVQEIEALQNEAYDLGADSVLHNRFGLSWDDAAGLRKEVARLQAATKWIPVTERLPEHSGEYLVFRKSHQLLLNYSEKHRRFNCFDWYSDNEAEELHIDGEYWRNLPEPPKEVE